MDARCNLNAARRNPNVSDWPSSVRGAVLQTLARAIRTSAQGWIAMTGSEGFLSEVEARQRNAARPRVSREEGRTVVWLVGEHDAATAFVLADTLARMIAVD